ncbi:MAG: hemolysin family protein [Planctomycetota bacterium]
MAIGLIVLWSFQVVLCGTAVIAIRLASRTKLITALKQAKRERWIDLFDLHEREYALTAQVYRQLALVLLVITVDMCIATGSPRWPYETLKVLLFCVAWFLLFGVAIPSAWARHAGEPFLARTLPAIELMRRITRPILIAVNAVDEIIRRLAGVPRETSDRAVEAEREIMDAVSSETVDESERAMIESVMVLDETSAGQIMTPRTDMVAIDSGASYEEVRKLVLDAGHSRIPVYEDTMDQVVGLLYAKDLLQVEEPAVFTLKEKMREVTFVPETKDLASLLREFQTNRVHLAIVLDEYGGTAGLITIEDILEELVGEITDEHDKPPLPPINRIDARTTDLDARVHVDEANKALDISLPQDESYDTIGGYVFSKLGHIPGVGESFVEDRVRVEILEADDRKVGRLRIHVLDPTGQE